ncbi:uncharacterized protein BDV17DRAFT_290429 [Aspergillus undulatus]|uniref:uncharacterized protein n=1 Tax=Aspergillus undulatus TaxID=1810928 RepID=UPI003CCD01FE
MFSPDPESQGAALTCSADMVLNALQHVDDCLHYLSHLNEQSVFEFCAIPQAMALATLELCFRNPELFCRNLKISNWDALRIMSESGQGMQGVCTAMWRYTRRIRRRNGEGDSSFREIDMVCDRIEKSIDTLLKLHDAHGFRHKGVNHSPINQLCSSLTYEVVGGMVLILSVAIVVYLPAVSMNTSSN